MAEVISSYDASDIRIHTLPDGKTGEKLRVLFNIKDKQKSIDCYKNFHESPSKMFEGFRTVLFLIKPEDIFVKYGDEEADRYYKEQEELKKQALVD